MAVWALEAFLFTGVSPTCGMTEKESASSDSELWLLPAPWALGDFVSWPFFFSFSSTELELLTLPDLNIFKS